MRCAEFDDPDLPLSRLFSGWPELALVFFNHQMLCPGCPVAPFHTIMDACHEYGLNEHDFRAELIRAVRPKLQP
jgi:hybrid cluster-associated redox disulfide protein